MKISLTVVILFTCNSIGYGQDADTVGPDRPSFSSSAHIVPAGHVQLEGGIGRWRFGDSSGRDIGELLVRAGVSGRVEVRAGIPSYLVSSDSYGRASGADDALVESKVLLKSGETVALGLLASATLPTGSRRVAEHAFQPGITLISDITVSGLISLTLNAAYDRASNGGQRYNSFLGVSTVNFALTPNVSTFAEFYAVTQQNDPAQKYAATGLAWTLKKRTAIDVSGGIGARNHAHGPDHYYGIGISHLF